MVNHSYECLKCGEQFDKLVKWDQRYVKCPCGGRAERQWATRRSRRFSEPIVLHRYADGTWGVPASASDPTPSGAERVECWNMSDYARATAKMNAVERGKQREIHEANERARAGYMEQLAKEVRHRISRASNEWERDMLRLTLERAEAGPRPFTGRDFYNESLEYNAGNRDGYYNERTGMRRAK